MKIESKDVHTGDYVELRIASTRFREARSYAGVVISTANGYLGVRTSKGEASLKMDSPDVEIVTHVPREVGQRVLVTILPMMTPNGIRWNGTVVIEGSSAAEAQFRAERLTSSVPGRIVDVATISLADGRRIGSAVVDVSFYSAREVIETFRDGVQTMFNLMEKKEFRHPNGQKLTHKQFDALMNRRPVWSDYPRAIGPRDPRVISPKEWAAYKEGANQAGRRRGAACRSKQGRFVRCR